jgi:hypothetical protein
MWHFKESYVTFLVVFMTQSKNGMSLTMFENSFLSTLSGNLDELDLDNITLPSEYSESMSPSNDQPTCSAALDLASGAHESLFTSLTLSPKLNPNLLNVVHDTPLILPPTEPDSPLGYFRRPFDFVLMDDSMHQRDLDVAATDCENARMFVTSSVLFSAFQGKLKCTSATYEELTKGQNISDEDGSLISVSPEPTNADAAYSMEEDCEEEQGDDDDGKDLNMPTCSRQGFVSDIVIPETPEPEDENGSVIEASANDILEEVWSGTSHQHQGVRRQNCLFALKGLALKGLARKTNAERRTWGHSNCIASASRVSVSSQWSNRDATKPTSRPIYYPPSPVTPTAQSSSSAICKSPDFRPSCRPYTVYFDMGDILTNHNPSDPHTICFVCGGASHGVLGRCKTERLHKIYHGLKRKLEKKYYGSEDERKETLWRTRLIQRAIMKSGDGLFLKG